MTSKEERSPAQRRGRGRGRPEDRDLPEQPRSGASRARRGEPAAPRTSLLAPLIALAVVLVVAAVALVHNLTGPDGDADGGPVAEVSGPAEADSGLAALARRIPDDPLAQGDVDAPVVLVMWSDYQCPFCGKFARETEPELVDRYVSDGVLRLEWRDFPYLGDQSQLTAQAARAAGQQGQYWEFHDAVYGLELTPQSGELTTERLTSIAADLGLNTGRFAADMTAQTTVDAVAADFAEGQSLGITGTPTFLVNSTPIVGAQPLDAFSSAIEDAAAAAGAPVGEG